LADSYGGLATARVLSLFFMLAATALLYSTTRRIFDRRAAFFAAALFAGLGATQFLGAFATYDAMAVAMLALASWLGVRAAAMGRRARLFLLILAGAALALANATKYASGLFDPVVIAGIHSHCIGGGLQVALACDLRIARDDARFGITAVKEGIIPGIGMWRAARFAGMGRAKRLALAADIIDATTALEWGLVDWVVGADAFEAKIADLTTRIARVTSRQRDASDADAAVARLQEGYDVGPLDWIEVDASGTPGETLARASGLLA